MAEGSSKATREKDAAKLFRYFNEIGIIAQLSSTMFEKAMPFGLTNAQFGVLNWFIRVDKEATPGRLAKAFQVTPAAMTNTLKRLQDKQLVRIDPDPDSGRKKRVTITAKGRRQQEQAIATAMPVLANMLAHIDRNEIERALPELEKVRIYLDELRYDESQISKGKR